MQRVVVCCSVLQCVAVCCSLMQFVCGALVEATSRWSETFGCNTLQHTATHRIALQRSCATLKCEFWKCEFKRFDEF